MTIGGLPIPLWTLIPWVLVGGFVGFGGLVGFDFDQVRLTNFDLQVPDAQACAIQP